MLCCLPPVPSRRAEGDPAPQPAPWKVQPASPLAGCTLRRRDEMRDAPRSTEGGLSSSGSSGWEGPTGLHCDPPAALINPGSVPADSQGDHKEDAGEIILAYLSGQPAPLRGGRGAEPPCALGAWVQMPSHAGPVPRPDTRWQAWPWDRGDGRALGGGSLTPRQGSAGWCSGAPCSRGLTSPSRGADMSPDPRPLRLGPRLGWAGPQHGCG